MSAQTRSLRNLLAVAAASLALVASALAPAAAGAAHLHGATCRPGQGTPWKFYIAPPLYTEAIVGHWYQIDVYQASSDIVGGAPIHLCAFARRDLNALTRVKNRRPKKIKIASLGEGFQCTEGPGLYALHQNMEPNYGEGLRECRRTIDLGSQGTVTQAIRIAPEPIVICDYVTVNGQRGPCSGSSVPPDANTGP